MAIVGLLAIASIPWLASAKATSTLVGYTDPATVPNIEQVSLGVVADQARTVAMAPMPRHV
jgi:hypothetical protein